MYILRNIKLLKCNNMLLSLILTKRNTFVLSLTFTYLSDFMHV